MCSYKFHNLVHVSHKIPELQILEFKNKKEKYCLSSYLIACFLIVDLRLHNFGTFLWIPVLIPHLCLC
jgi:hypothetical protein